MWGIGMVIKAGASTGGMDIPPLILNKKIGLPVSVGLYVFDFLIRSGKCFLIYGEKPVWHFACDDLYSACR